MSLTWTQSRTQTRNRQRAWAAVVFALAVHAALLGAMGLVHPHFVAPPVDDIPDIQLELTRRPAPAPTRAAPVRPAETTQTVERAAPATHLAPPAPPPPSVRPVPGSPAAVPSTVDVAGAEVAPPGCATEDLILLTDQEKAHCREQVELLKARRAAAAADAERAARMAAIRQGPKIDAIDPEKRAQYDAAVANKAANQANADAFAAGTGGQIPHCSIRLGRGGSYAPPGSKKVGPFLCTP